MNATNRSFERASAFSGEDALSKQVLEIGALHRPTLGRNAENVYYADFATTSELQALYAPNPAYDVSEFVDVDFIVKDGNYAESVGDKRFDLVLASHVAEHMPNLIHWLAQIHAILAPGGELSLILPDKRFTFDVIKDTTHTMELLQAYEWKRTRPDVWCVYRDLLLHTPLQGMDLHHPPREPVRLRRVHPDTQARHEAWVTMQNGTYRDSHCSIVTPTSFLKNLEELAAVDLMPFEVSAFHDTQTSEIDFFIRLQRQEVTDKDRILASITAAQAKIVTAARYVTTTEEMDVIVQADDTACIY